MINAEKIILSNVVTEKATEASSNLNAYTFKVSGSANKIAIAQAVEKAFPNVNVEKVNVINVTPKIKRDRYRRGKYGVKSGYKKAIVTLRAGQTIDSTI